MDNDDKSAILKRRARLIQSALVAAGLSLGAAGCDDSKPAPEEDVTSQDTTPQPCLTAPADTREDTQTRDTESGDTDIRDTAPEVCLEPPLDIIEDSSQPEVCLSDVVPEETDGTG